MILVILWALLILTILGMMGIVNKVGKPREPISHGEAVVSVVLGTFYVVFYLYLIFMVL